jgi:hypothetical protein
MPQIAEVFPKVVRPIGKGLYDIKRLGPRQDVSQPEQELLPNSVSGL